MLRQDTCFFVQFSIHDRICAYAASEAKSRNGGLLLCNLAAALPVEKEIQLCRCVDFITKEADLPLQRLLDRRISKRKRQHIGNVHIGRRT